MASLRLPSIFHSNSIKREKSTPPQSLLSKRSTIASASRLQYEESIANDDTTAAPLPAHSLQRSNTLSKMKRFGSLLTRSKRSNSDTSTKRTRVDTIFPPYINTSSLASSHSLSTTSTHSTTTTHNASSSDEDEDSLLTPSNAFVTPATFFTTSPTSPFRGYFDHNKTELVTTTVAMVPPASAAVSQHIDDIMSLTHVDEPGQYPNQIPIMEEPEEEIQDDYMTDNYFESFLLVPQQPTPHVEHEEPKEKEEEEKEVDPSTLNGVALVRYHLSMALQEVDTEIENELNTCREEMIKAIHTLPILIF